MTRRPVRFRRAAWTSLVLVAVGIQFVPIDRDNPPVRADVSAPAEVSEVLHRACYDCHSNETRWPWYAHVAPVSWFVTGHVKEARGDLNFSEWPTWDFELQGEALRDVEEQVSRGKMPLRSYTLLHPAARLDDKDRELLLRWARSGGPGFD